MDIKNEVKKQLKDGAPIVAGGYLKRMMEKVYDKLFQTKLSQKLKNADTTTRHGLELLLYLLTVIFDKKFPANTVLQKTIKEVGGDMASSLGKRIINGDTVTENQNQPALEPIAHPNPNNLLENQRPTKESNLTKLAEEAIQNINETTEAIEKLRQQITQRRSKE